MIHVLNPILQLRQKVVAPLVGSKITLFSFLVMISILIIFPLDLILAYFLTFRDKVYPNVKVANLDLGGLTVVQAREKISRLKPQTFPTLTLKSDQGQWFIEPEALKVTVDATATARQVFAVGRYQPVEKNLVQHWRLLRRPQVVIPEVSFDLLAWQTLAATISAAVDRPAVPPAISLTGFGQQRQAQVSSGQPGHQVDMSQLTQQVHSHFYRRDATPITLPIVPVLPAITTTQAETTRQRARQLLNKSLQLKTSQNTWSLNDEEMINFLSFTNDLDGAKIASWTAQLAQSIDRPPQNALFRFENGKVAEFKPAIEGLTLEQSQTVAKISQAIKNLEKGSETTLSLDLPIQSQPPTITTAQVNNLGIKELIGRGESWFSGSIPSRIHNIQLAAQKISGTLVPPGETFSFNQTVGEIDRSTGFQQAYVIQNGRTVLGDGGGVCQVSTTLFRAALNAGLPIEERRAHAYRVGYYEQNSPVGLDATVFGPTVDFKFKNDTPAHILIQTNIDTSQSKLTFELYGSSDGRQVNISPSRIWDQTPPPPDLYQDDPTLPAGTVKQVDWKAWGAKVAFDWKVTRDSEMLQERTFYSTYRPWQAVFLRGTGGQ